MPETTMTLAALRTAAETARAFANWVAEMAQHGDDCDYYDESTAGDCTCQLKNEDATARALETAVALAGELAAAAREVLDDHDVQHSVMRSSEAQYKLLRLNALLGRLDAEAR